MKTKLAAAQDFVMQAKAYNYKKLDMTFEQYIFAVVDRAIKNPKYEAAVKAVCGYSVKQMRNEILTVAAVHDAVMTAKEEFV